MKLIIARWLWLRSEVVILLAFACLGLPVCSGEPIQFSKGQSKVGPDVPGTGDKAKAKLETRDGSTHEILNPAEAASSESSFSREQYRKRDPKQERRQKNAALEKQNWLILEQGELQDKDDEKTAFGIRDYSADSLEKDKTAADLWFGSKAEGDKRTPAHMRSPSGDNRSGARGRPELPERRGEPNLKQSSARDEEDSKRSLNGNEQGGRNGLAQEPGALNTDLFRNNANITTGARPANSVDDRGRREELGLRSLAIDFGADRPGLGGGLGFGNERLNRSLSPSLDSGRGLSGLVEPPGLSRPSPGFSAPGLGSPSSLNDLSREGVSSPARPGLGGGR